MKKYKFIQKISLIILDISFVAIVLILAPVFSATKNICNLSDITYCYSIYYTISMVTISIVFLINIFEYKINFIKAILMKISIFITPIICYVIFKN